MAHILLYVSFNILLHYVSYQKTNLLGDVMKKFITMLSCLAMLLATGSAFATPVYYGSTDATYGTGGVPALPTESGYYIWTNDPQRTSWSVRWTGNNNGAPASYNWFGSIEFGGLNRETTTKIMFDNNDKISIVDDFLNLGDFVTWQAVAGPAWDGFDFTISGQLGNVLGFNLGSSLFTQLLLTGQDTAGTGIFIGQNRITPMVLVQNYNTSGTLKTQNFEIPAPVPEPGTIVLLGAGLVGVGLYLKRRKA